MTKMSLKKTRQITWMCLLASLLLVNSSFAQKKIWKIGGLFSVTGPASFLGDPEKKSMEMAIEQINAAGGIDGHLLEAVIYDTEGSPQKAVSAVNKLIHRDRVKAIIGPSTTPSTMAVVNFAQKARIPLISCAAGIKITSPVKEWVFKTAQSDLLAVEALYKHMSKIGLKNIGIITVSNSFGESGREQLKSQADKYGLNILSAESFGNKDTDMTAQLTKIRKQKPDAIVCWGTNPGPAVVARNMRQLEMDIPLFQSHGVASPRFIDLAGEASENIVLPTGKILVSDLLNDSEPQKLVLTSYENGYRDLYKKPVSGFGGYAYDAMNILSKALTGSNGDKVKIRENLENITDHVGVSGVFNFSKTDHNGLSSDAFVLVKIQNGKWNLLP